MSLSDFRVLVAICAHANDGKAWCSLPTISAMTGIDVRNLPRAVAALERGGYLRRDGWHNGKATRARNYEVIYGEPNSSPQMTLETTATSSPEMSSDEQATSSHQMTSPEMTSSPQMIRVISPDDFEVISPDDVDATHTLYTKNQTLEQTRTDHKSIRIADTFEVEFAEFWSLVSKKVDKIKAAEKFRHARTKKRVPAATMIDAMRTYAQGYAPHTDQDPKYSTGPAIWLHNERWTDEPTAVTQTQPRGKQHHAKSASKLAWLLQDEDHQPFADIHTIDGEISQ